MLRTLNQISVFPVGSSTPVELLAELRKTVELRRSSSNTSKEVFIQCSSLAPGRVPLIPFWCSSKILFVFFTISKVIIKMFVPIVSMETIDIVLLLYWVRIHLEKKTRERKEYFWLLFKYFSENYNNII